MKIYATRHMKRPDIYRYELFNHLQLQCSLRCVNFASRKRTVAIKRLRGDVLLAITLYGFGQYSLFFVLKYVFRYFKYN